MNFATNFCTKLQKKIWTKLKKMSTKLQQNFVGSYNKIFEEITKFCTNFFLSSLNSCVCERRSKTELI